MTVGAITEYINAHTKPFIWTASANDILAKVKRARRPRSLAHRRHVPPAPPKKTNTTPRNSLVQGLGPPLTRY